MCTDDPLAGVPGPLRSAFVAQGFGTLTAVQRAVLAADSAGRNLRISSQTGSGKTVALGLVLTQSLLQPREEDAAARVAGPRALVITPTRELAMQVRDELRWLLAELPGVRVEAVTGGTDIGAECRMLRRAPAVLVGTPGRLLDHLRSQSLCCDDTVEVVLDEADRMLDMGFRDELDAIIDQLPPTRRSHLVSATFGGAVRRVADRFQGEDALHIEGTTLGEANADIDHVAYVVGRGQAYPTLVNALLLALGQRVLVFVDRRTDAADLAEQLAGDGFGALPFSGDLSQAQRNRTLYAFRTGTIQVLVSTDVAARGIDVPDITMVVHMAAPRNADGYTHRAGRTGRAGRRGRSVLLVSPRGQGHARRLLQTARVEADWPAPPSPAKVHKAIVKRTRKRLHARLADPQAEPDATTRAYATQLLEGRDPAEVVATLLELAQPNLPREPMEIPSAPPPGPPREPRRKSRAPRRFGPRRKG